MTSLPAPGDRIGRFRLERELGRGGMGVVFAAVEETLGRRVALKVIAPQFAGDPEFRGRFVREARAQASLDSSHVVPVFAHGEEDGCVYIATQLVPDGDLGGLLASAGPFSLADGTALIEQVTRGLCDAHDAGLVHRDIKPGNVLLRRRGSSLQAYLADFGIARRVDQEATRIGAGVVVAGTPSTMAPELHSGVRASEITDVYALGCLFWTCLTGETPYPGDTELEIVTGHLQAPIPQLDARTPLGLAVNRALRLALAKDPEHRYPSALALRDDLRSALRLPVSDDDRRAVAGLGADARTHRAPGDPAPSATPLGRAVPDRPMPSVQAPWTPPAEWAPPRSRQVPAAWSPPPQWTPPSPSPQASPTPAWVWWTLGVVGTLLLAALAVVIVVALA